MQFCFCPDSLITLWFINRTRSCLVNLVWFQIQTLLHLITNKFSQFLKNVPRKHLTMTLSAILVMSMSISKSYRFLLWSMKHTWSNSSGLILNDTSQKFLMNSIFLANSKVMPKATHTRLMFEKKVCINGGHKKLHQIWWWWCKE